MTHATQRLHHDTDGDGEALCYYRLEQPWRDWASIARSFSYQVEEQDREDLMHNIILRLAEVADEYRRQRRVLTRWGCIRVAEYARLRFYRDKKRWGRMCSASLNGTIEDEEGNTTELGDTIADDRDIDWDLWLDAKMRYLSSTGSTRRAIDKLVNKDKRELSGYDWKLVRGFRRT
jgi:hypothetical protein